MNIFSSHYRLQGTQPISLLFLNVYSTEPHAMYILDWLFLAANAGLSEHVLLLRKSGAHLHSDERQAAELLARRRPAVWGLAGIGPREVSDREMEEENESLLGRREIPSRMVSGSAP